MGAGALLALPSPAGFGQASRVDPGSVLASSTAADDLAIGTGPAGGGDLAFRGSAVTDNNDGRSSGSATGSGPDVVAGPSGGRGAAERWGSVPFGTPEMPFVDLGAGGSARAVRTPSGVVLPVIADRDGAYLALTACEDVVMATGEPLGRAHVVLDPGHGGTEVGAVAPNGLTEKEVNLAVALRTRDLLEAQGATVVLTRSFDHNITTGARGVLAKSIDPGLFVSIHHNGGTTGPGDRPGIMSLVKTDSQSSRRFGGVLYQRLSSALAEVGRQRQAQAEVYAAALAQHEAAEQAHLASVDAHNAAVAANQAALAPVPTTTTTAATELSDPTASSIDQSTTTTTAAPTSTPTTVMVPDTVPAPPPFDQPAVAPLGWWGSANAGVRAWTRADGKDYLSVLRHSGDVPAVLAEFLYMTNPAEADLLADPAFIDIEAKALADAIVAYFADPSAQGDGFVADQFDDQPIGGGGLPRNCVEPPLSVTD